MATLGGEERRVGKVKGRLPMPIVPVLYALYLYITLRL